MPHGAAVRVAPLWIVASTRMWGMLMQRPSPASFPASLAGRLRC